MKSTEISLSFGQLALAQCLASSAAAVLWFGGALVGGFEIKIALAGPAEAGTLLAVSLVILGLFRHGNEDLSQPLQPSGR